MTLNHLNLAVTDAREAAEFLVKYFGLRPMDGVKMSPKFSILRDDQGMVLTMMQPIPGEAVAYPSTFHIGFIQPTAEAVDVINARLREDGFDVPPPARMHGSWTFYFTAPGGFTIEVLA